MVWFDRILRSLFGTIDGILGWAASTLYKLIVQIANVDIFGNYIYTMMGRIYTFLAIFMLFKLSISVVNYVLNPDQLTDKSKGFGKLIQNVIIVMALIIMTPQIFNWAYKLQAAILNTNVLYTIVTGKPNDSSYDPSDLQGLTSKEIVAILTKNAEDSGDMIKYELLSTFIYNEHSEDEHTAVRSDGTLCNKETTGSYSAAYDCLMDGDTINNTSGSSSDKHYGAKKGFRNEYKILVSTLCIGFAAYVFLVTAFDVALRCVKLGALQLMAPVPIISMLDPNSGKSGMFSKWLKECKNTYLSLFTRLISVYFAVEVIRGLTEPGRFVWYGTDVAVGFGFVKVFVILGLLMFAKQLPKFIEDATGIKMDTGGLNLKKKLDSVPGLNAAKGLAAGAAVGTVGAFTGAGALRGLSGAWQGMRAGMQGKKFGEIRKGQVDANKKMRTAILNGSTFAGRFSNRVSEFVGTRGQLGNIEAQKHDAQDQIDRLDNEIKGFEDRKREIQGSAEYINRQKELSGKNLLADSIKAMEERAKSEIQNGNSIYAQEYSRLSAMKEQIVASGGSADDIAAADNAMREYLNNSGMKAYVTHAMSDDDFDKSFTQLKLNAQQAASNIGETLADNGDAIHSQFGKTKQRISEIKRDGNADDLRIAELDREVAQRNREKAPYNDTIRSLNERESVANANNSAIK